jgi:UDP-N-acetyl-2-amino-2-deoxyglucuronate dehydrogenase
MARVRMGVIGLGMASQPHAAALRDLDRRVEVAGCYSRTAARRDEFGARTGLPVTDDLDGIFEDSSIDVVMILTPPATHLELVRRAAEVGTHVLLEKPLEIDTGRAAELVEVAERAGITLGVVLQNRQVPASLALEAAVAEGRLGEIASVSLRLRNWRPQGYYDEPGRGTLARDGGGVLLTQGIHPIDQLIAFAGLPDEVAAFATTSALHRMETEDLVACALRWQGGALGSLHATTAAYPGYPTEFEIIGTRGSAVLTDRVLTTRFQDGSEEIAGEIAAGGGHGADPMAFSHLAHRAVLDDFLEAVVDGRKPKSSGRDVLRSHDLIDAILEAGRTGSVARVRRR